MYKFLSIIWFRFQQMIKDPATVIMLIAMPLLFAFIFGGLTTSSEQTVPKLAVVSNADSCILCDELSSALEQNHSYEWMRMSRDKATLAVEEKDVIAAIVVRDQPYSLLLAGEAPFEIIVKQKTDQYIALEQFVSALANQLYEQAQRIEAAGEQGMISVLEHMNSKPYIEVEAMSYAAYQQEDLEQRAKINASLRVVGFTIMFLMFTLSGSALMIHNERDDHTWHRLRSSSVSYNVIIAGYIGALWILGWVQFIVLSVYMQLVNGISWGSYMVPFVSLMILMVVSLSVFMATSIKSRKQADGLNAILIVSTCMLGGVYWPLEIVPELMQKVAYIIPQYWMMRGMEFVMSNERDWSLMWQPWVILLAYSLIFMIISIRNLKKEQ